MLNRGSVSWCLKYQSMVALSSTEVEYVALMVVLKKAMWLRLLLIELGLLLPNNQYTEIKVIKENKGIKKIKANLRDQEEENNERIVLKVTLIDFSTLCKAISLKDNNQGLITLIHNSVYYAQTKHIDILYYYIYNEVTIR